MNQATALLKVLLLAAVIVAGVVYLAQPGTAKHDPGRSSSRDWVQAFLTVGFSYHGWDNATLVDDRLFIYESSEADQCLGRWRNTTLQRPSERLCCWRFGHWHLLYLSGCYLCQSIFSLQVF